jgi:hypothetical protein
VFHTLIIEEFKREIRREINQIYLVCLFKILLPISISVDASSISAASSMVINQKYVPSVYVPVELRISAKSIVNKLKLLITRIQALFFILD